MILSAVSIVSIKSLFCLIHLLYSSKIFICLVPYILIMIKIKDSRKIVTMYDNCIKKKKKLKNCKKL